MYVTKATNAKQVTEETDLATNDVGGKEEVGVEPDPMAPVRDSRMQY